MVDASQRTLHTLWFMYEQFQILAAAALDGLFGALDLDFRPARLHCVNWLPFGAGGG